MRSDLLAGQNGTLRPLTGEALLSAWERGARRSWSEQALGLLSASRPDLPRAAAREMPVAGLDRMLLELHRQTFGETMPAFTVCDTCGERLEFELPCDWAAGVLNATDSDTLIEAGWSVTIRPATSSDLEHAAAAPGMGAARRVVVGRCVSAVGPDGMAVPFDDLPEPIQVMAEARLVALHDATELSAALTCPECQAARTVLVDIPGYVWAETRHAARRLIADVSEIAHAYGWAEAAILAMSTARRRAYLEMIRA